ncbi:hypothetical protein [Corallincola spongiicola]|uniref:Uncharacterized protein n=1 Tax=Corallincola spongiicola TaxID=2520508 RepID=A0ABY1WPV3_9GAMM|nr:hypothetical protein [Corallincola spongiicola]TAA46027.1 hypothetical protein EXY25_11835 [Corallincola spongiicola]
MTVSCTRYCLEVMTVMKCFCCDKKATSSELLVVNAQTYCHACAVGLFGESALTSPVPQHSGTLGRLGSHLKVFFFLASGLWLLVLLYELLESAYKFFKARFSL